MPGPWNEREPVAKKDAAPVDWDQFKSDVEHERGLFKILALYVDDKLKKRKRRTLQQYMKAEESRRFAAGLDLATVAFDWAVISPLMSIVGIPTVAVGVALVGVQYGYRRLTDTDVDRVGDEFS
jgi:hypothetical protein